MTTARDLIEQAMKKINVLGVGSTLTAEDAADGLSTLNNMISSWSVEGGFVYNDTRETFPLVNGQETYTIGSGGDFDTVKPYEIQAVYVTQGVTDYPLTDFDQKQYALITQKDILGVPNIFYFDNNFPLSNILLYPVPSNTTSISIYSTKILTSFTGLTNDISLPAGYDHALIYNLAVELAPNYEKEASPTVQRIAGDSKAVVYASNAGQENDVLYVDRALVSTGGYNIYRGE